MLLSLKTASQRQAAWWLLAFSALALELVALYMQHFMHLKPCVMCIYERCALFGVMLAGIVGALTAKTPLRWLAIIGWLFSAGKGLLLAWRHTDIQLHPSPFNSCDFFVRFPAFLPLDKWLPSVFQATGDCAEKQWQFLQLQMPQWMMIIFAVYLLIAVLVLLSQFSRQK